MALKTPQTELEAVNIILSSVGEDNVNVLGTDTTGLAEAVLDEVSREIQERGWHFNTEDDYTVTVASDGSVTLPDNIAQFDLTDGTYDVVMRGSRLYSKAKHSFTLFPPGSLNGSVVLLLAWSELPPTARRYLTLEAAHRYQKRWFSSDTLVGFTQEDLRKAKSLFEDSEAIQADRTIFDNYSVYRTIDRRSGSEFAS